MTNIKKIFLKKKIKNLILKAWMLQGRNLAQTLTPANLFWLQKMQTWVTLEKIF